MTGTAADEIHVLGLVVLLLLMFMVLAPAYLVTRPSRLSLAATTDRPATPRSAAPEPTEQCSSPALPHGVRLDDYIRLGLADLQIMLVQSARRRR